MPPHSGRTFHCVVVRNENGTSAQYAWTVALYFQVVSPRKWTKGLYWGAAECEPTQWNAWRLVRGFQTTSSWTAQLVRLHQPRLDAGRCQTPSVLLPTNLCKQFLKNLLWNHNARVSRKPSLSSSCAPTSGEATLARIIFNCLTRILFTLDRCGAHVTALTESKLYTMRCPWQTHARCTFYWTRYLQL